MAIDTTLSLHVQATDLPVVSTYIAQLLPFECWPLGNIEPLGRMRPRGGVSPAGSPSVKNGLLPSDNDVRDRAEVVGSDVDVRDLLRFIEQR